MCRNLQDISIIENMHILRFTIEIIEKDLQSKDSLILPAKVCSQFKYT